MDSPDPKAPGFVDLVKSWIPRKTTESSSTTSTSHMSRDFWMPDHSCPVCYECDAQFTVFNRRHHCRLCGRVFCAKCAANSIPSPSDETKDSHEESSSDRRIRVCNYCYKQWEQGIVPPDKGASIISLHFSSSPSASTTSNCTSNSSNCTVDSATGPKTNPPGSGRVSSNMDMQNASSSSSHRNHSSQDPVEFFVNSGRSDGEAYDDDDYNSDYAQSYSQGNDYYGAISLDEVDRIYGSHVGHDAGENIESNIPSVLPPDQDLDALNTDTIDTLRQQADGWNDEKDGSPPCEEAFESEVVDFESDGLLWLPPEPENEEDEREGLLSDDEGDEGDRGDWGYLRPSNSFKDKELHSREKSGGAMKNVVEGHFRALVAQLLEVDNLPMVDEGDREGWLDIITSLSWEAATLLKPDTSKSGGMDPGGYVKVKCIPCGRRSESMVVRGVVCKKNVAHRRMTSKIEKPRLLILGGALEYQRISNQLSSFDTLLQQEMDHLKMAVAKIDSHNPQILLVEKSVSRFAQEYLLAKDISLVLNIKRPLLERISRCTGAQIVPSVDQLTSPKLGYCDLFHVEKFVETHGQGVKKLAKTLMYFDGCPKPLGCTILLKGAHEDELKRVKHVIQYGVFAAYHLALETSFLADEGASLPELPLQTPITVALPDKPSPINRSISTIPGFAASSAEKSPTAQLMGEPHKANGDVTGNFASSKTHFQGKLDGNDRTEPSKQNMSTDPEMITSKDNGLVPTLIPRQLSFHAEGASIQKDQWSVLPSPTEQVTDGADTNESTVTGDQNFSRHEQMDSSKGDFLPSASDHQSILVSASTRCVWKGSVCERAHLLRIKYYGSFDKPLGRFLRDNLFDQDRSCPSCAMPAEAHIHSYIHRQGSLTISVKKLPELLPGQREGKIWMWHRCLKCPRIGGFPPATRRIVMSDAAWGLSFGKFLELSFSNHAAASRVANCGHSLHRDCLRFYGFGKMVACFRYASINIFAVSLPPSKLEFNCETQDWLQKESKEVIIKAEVLFNEVHEALSQISSKTMGANSKGSTSDQIRLSLEELAGLLEQRKKEYKESLQQMLSVSKDGQPTIDILLINKLRRLILFDSYAWDECLTGAASMVRNNYSEALRNPATKVMGRDVSLDKLGDEKEKSISTNAASSNDSLPSDAEYDKSLKKGKSFSDISRKSGTLEDVGSDIPSDRRIESESSEGGKENVVEPSQVVKRVLSESQSQATDLSDTLDAAWIGEQAASENGISRPPSRAASANGTHSYDLKLLDSESGPTNEENTMQVQMPSPSFYYSLNKNYSLNSRKHIMAEDRPVYVSSYRELEWQSGARLLLPLGINDLVLPVYDDEPTSIIAYALTSSEYNAQMSGSDKARDRLDSGGSFSLFDSVNLLSLNSLSDLSVDMSRSLSSADEQVSQLLQSSLYLKDLHARVSFTDESPPGKVKYSVTCYYAKEFEALRKICCPSETDFIRSLGRCRKWGAQGGKSNVFFAKTLDDRFIIKQVTKTELESFIKFAPAYFKYLTDSICTKSPTSLAKILGIYQVSSKHFKGGKEFKMDVLVMENLLFKRNFARLYDLKGSTRARYNPDTSGSNTVLLDQNLVEAMPTSPIFVGSKAKRLLERAVWNDTSFLASIHVMDYSLLVGVDEERSELVLGTIDFMRQYTWDKHLETWVKTSGLLGGPKNSTPTVISPQQYKKRFRKAMTAYFLMVPDQWSPATVVPSNSSSAADVKDEEERDDRPGVR
ncbi:1-phosphatidylinositol-3-phosphate 5-kinase FAB1A [Raphanus sativus]|uniref:1-phosphatidylinositol-3-phosphate 5-kinase n=1 Tax=Raphanus sativus TaxID=3726 RepID=A0A6J0MD35_RAPSA|nr:1-phosphatidylinositol-3-phosphate 5-kinase FAB1A [Raphanus sativus]XP_018470431.1 1-phosphatidylinositol-3-phosphate 5-kinase FAB1A [Raphanus sativus]XP_056859581.1 1-phosphatidylinositol-3-phosphate 5-kinase FAB1A [Raphanus sativus]KAJ4913819.1 1-phosphatidylinositol-3-phosphate 5-kinase FAB1A [Raphanus sativus]